MEFNRHTITYGTNSLCSTSSRIFTLWRTTKMYEVLQESHCINFSRLLASFCIPKIHLESILPDLFEFGEEILTSHL